MHGVKRTRYSAEALEARRLKEHSKLEAYLKLDDDVLAKKKAKDWTLDALNLTTRLLTTNPELYTVWNYRRDIFTNGVFVDPQCTPSDIRDILITDLELVTSFLRQYPKVYWIWNHRRWCLEHIPDGPAEDSLGWKKTSWAMELRAVEKMLDVDARNFHAWAYRRYVLASMPVKRSESAELAYTKQKIEANFSNFSAWHQRSKVFTSMWEQGLLDEAKSKEEEFELVKQALYVDPYDQSSWIYHRWLIGDGSNETLLQREIGVIEELSEVEPDCKWCLEMLVHYKKLRLEKYLSHKPGIETERDRVRSECLSMLSKLEKIDSYRAKRYQEISENLRNA
ncbi:rab-protein geranylgeranyltransferase [Fomitiporia mediterranea MF3/22]|uniref:rab-protein geranylgeranyltransferase n=1 Tax=Fomitiporia mediterranea (strain MF3/22) TaxID=694068 RepID=UPI000440857A|nr:rab-protein geranylgeranyltransferase [Fomitiporia mediterranea MF3/22]EJD05742.1 rab-protein geranylgeranyltransferase [Fomitiporia mediterranea MF3/22]